MATNFLVNGTDLDSIFAAYESGTKKPVTGYQVAGVDLSERYAPIEQGSAAAVTGLRAGGADLNTIFAAIGTLSAPIAGLDGKELVADDSGGVAQPNSGASTTVSINSNGNWSVSGFTAGLGTFAQPAPTSGTWIRSGVVADYEVQFDASHIGSSDRKVTNDAPVWASLSTSRSLVFELPIKPYETTPMRDANATVRIRIRRAGSGAVVSDNSITMFVYTNPPT